MKTWGRGIYPGQQIYSSLKREMDHTAGKKGTKEPSNYFGGASKHSSV